MNHVRGPFGLLVQKFGRPRSQIIEGAPGDQATVSLIGSNLDKTLYLHLLFASSVVMYGQMLSKRINYLTCGVLSFFRLRSGILNDFEDLEFTVYCASQ